MVVLKEVKSMFWALYLEPGKRYSQKVEKAFHISMAALEIPLDHDAVKAKHSSTVAVMVGMEKGEFLMSTLNYKTLYQQPLDLNFYEGEEVTFYVNGEGNVHLTGFVMEDGPDDSALFDDEDYEEGMADSDEEESDNEVPQLVASKGSKRKKANDFAPAKKMKWIEDEAEEDSEEDSDDDSDDIDDSQMLQFEDDDDDDDDEEDESDDEVEMVQTKKVKQTPKEAKQKQKQQEQQKSGKDKQKNKEVKSQPSTPASKPGPEGDASQSEKKKKKKKKKNKNKDEESASPQKQEQQKPQTPKQSQTPKPSQTPKKQVLAGGTVMEEIRPGNGPVAKPGKMVHVYYLGKLQKDGRQFDSCTSGKPFRFRLGSGEVIKGWDNGLSGMKVGGKRKLIVPPPQAYGNQKMGGIPPNSTLVFEVELKSIS